jgi:hypothetical protein
VQTCFRIEILALIAQRLINRLCILYSDQLCAQRITPGTIDGTPDHTAISTGQFAWQTRNIVVIPVNLSVMLRLALLQTDLRQGSKVSILVNPEVLSGPSHLTEQAIAFPDKARDTKSIAFPASAAKRIIAVGGPLLGPVSGAHRFGQLMFSVPDKLLICVSATLLTRHIAETVIGPAFIFINPESVILQGLRLGLAQQIVRRVKGKIFITCSC